VSSSDGSFRRKVGCRQRPGQQQPREHQRCTPWDHPRLWCADWFRVSRPKGAPTAIAEPAILAASAADLKAIADDPLALKHGELALTAGKNRIELVPLPEREEA